MFPCTHRLVYVLVAFACLVPSLRADIYLRGVMEQDGMVSLLLKHSHYPTQLEWVVTGGSFRDYIVKSYDSAREVVRLQKGSQLVEAKLSGSPAKIPPASYAAGRVTEKAGVRCCAVHGMPLVEAKGFTTLPETTACYSLAYVMSVAPKRDAEFPNSFGGSFSREKSPLYPLEVVREHCVQCDAAHARYFAQQETAASVHWGGPIPSPFR